METLAHSAMGAHNMQIFYRNINDDGQVVFGQIDEHDNIVNRSKQDYPYSYDGFVQERVHPNKDSMATVWTDRLSQWDYDLTKKLKKKYFGNEGDCWSDRSAEDIQKFLRERLDIPSLEVTLVMEYCNQSSGYPLWRIDYKYDKAAQQLLRDAQKARKDEEKLLTLAAEATKSAS